MSKLSPILYLELNSFNSSRLINTIELIDEIILELNKDLTYYINAFDTSRDVYIQKEHNYSNAIITINVDYSSYTELKTIINKFIWERL